MENIEGVKKDIEQALVGYGSDVLRINKTHPIGKDSEHTRFRAFNLAREKRLNQILALIEPNDPDREGEEETRKSLAEGHGITFPNAQEAIKWLQSDESRLLTKDEILTLIKRTGWSIKRAESLNLVSNYTTVAEAQLDKCDAENKELGLLLKSRVGGIDEFNDWSERGLRRFREKILPIIREHCLKLAKGDLGILHKYLEDKDAECQDTYNKAFEQGKFEEKERCKARIERIKREIEKLGATLTGLIIIDPDKPEWQEIWKQEGIGGLI